MNEDQSWPNELKGQVDDAHLTTDRANIPPPGLWNQIRAQVQPQTIANTKERQPMMNATTLPHSIATPSRSVSEKAPGGLRHYTSLAATFALVLAVAVGGWLAMSQMPGGGDRRFAALQGTAEVAHSQTCDVEPMTVDEVMEIVRNPYRYIYDRAEPEAREQNPYAPMADLTLAEGLPMPNRWEAESVNRVEPSDDEFNDVTAFVDQYARCAEDATYGQYWALIHPVWVQSDILSAFPVFADEQQVRSQVEEVIGVRIDRGENSLKAFYDVYGSVTITANRDITEADRLLWSMSSDEPIVAIGVRVTDENGEIIMETDSTGFPSEIRDGSITLRPVIVVQRSSLTDDWYVLPWLGQYS